ncbi:MAG TPA: hypothetical protein VM010_05570 [Chitinophagaceae bacterium]|nr:hypothetical protein [Chitinophagaceae bacterium]
MIKKMLLSGLFQMLILIAVAQDSSAEMADTFRRDGKIYVVVAVMLTILAGIVLYLVRLDRKLSKLEKAS